MCNRSLQEGILPPSQKHAVITPIIKKAGSDPLDAKSYRPVSNLSYMSKLVERMVSRRLTRYLEGEKLLPKFQSGFRARHSTETAILKVLSDILTAADLGKVWILGLLDMSAAFDTVDHSILFDRLETAYGFSGTVLSWMRSFLTDRDQRVVFGGSSSATSIVKFGVPQGSVLGPLLFVLYTADIQHIAEGFNLGVHCYADDGQLYLYDRVQALPGVISTVVSCIAEIESWMNSNRLKINSEKTQLIWLGSRHELVKISTTSINLGSCTVDFLKTVNDLGVTIDCQLSMKDHVRVCTTAYYHLRQLRSIRGSLSADSCSTLVRAFITSRIDYCNSLLAGVDKSQVGKLQSILRVAARLIMRKRKFDPISDDIRDKLHWLPVEQRIQFKIGVLVYRCLHGNAPSYLSEMLTAVADVSGRRSLRSAARGDLVIPRTRTLGYGSRMFAVSGPSFWNSLPLGLRDINLTESVFRRQLKTFLFRNAYGINLLV